MSFVRRLKIVWPDDDVLQEILYQLTQIPSIPVHADVVLNSNTNATLDMDEVGTYINGLANVSVDDHSSSRDSF